MGKTYKKLPQSTMRRPRGWKQAKINNARHKSIPPNAWEDLPHDDHCYVPYNVAEQMVMRGYNKEKITTKLKSKFNLSHREAKDIADWAIKYVWRPND